MKVISEDQKRRWEAQETAEGFIEYYEKHLCGFRESFKEDLEEMVLSEIQQAMHFLNDRYGMEYYLAPEDIFYEKQRMENDFKDEGHFIGGKLFERYIAYRGGRVQFYKNRADYIGKKYINKKKEQK